MRLTHGNVGRILIAFALLAAPPAALAASVPFSGNNDLADAQLVIAGSGVKWTGSNVGATEEPGETTPCALDSTVWFTFVGNGATLETAGSNFDVALAAYAGPPLATSPTQLSFIACGTAPFSFSAGFGSLYVQVGGLFGSQGNIVLEV